MTTSSAWRTHKCRALSVRQDSASLVASRRLLLLGRALARQTGQRQIGHDAGTRPAAGIDDRLVGATEHPLCRFFSAWAAMCCQLCAIASKAALLWWMTSRKIQHAF
jgi:hypothetical protein